VKPAPAVAIVLVLSGCGDRAPSVDTPPDPDLAQAEPEVRDHLKVRRSAVLESPRSAAAWGSFAMALDIHDFKSDAARCYRQAEALDPGDPRWPRLLGLVYLPADPASALEAFARSRPLGPEDRALDLYAGEALLALNRPAEARAYFETARAAKPAAPHADVGLARCALVLGDKASARAALDPLVTSGAAHREAWSLLAAACRMLGDLSGAAKAAEAARRASPAPAAMDPARDLVLAEGRSAVHLAIQADQALARGDVDEAIARFRRSLAARPDPARPRTTLAQALHRAGRRKEALVEIREAVRRDPSHPLARRALVTLLSANERNEEAALAAREGLATWPDDAVLRVRLARVLLRMSDRAGAVEVLRAAPAKDREVEALLAQLLASGPGPPR
jgi:predicted Zn-dependent protease